MAGAVATLLCAGVGVAATVALAAAAAALLLLEPLDAGREALWEREAELERVLLFERCG